MEIEDIITSHRVENVKSVVVSKPKSVMKSQLASNDMLKTLFPNLTKIGAICLSMNPCHDSLSRSFSQMKLIKTHSTSSLNDKSFSNLMKIALESPVELVNVCMEQKE